MKRHQTSNGGSLGAQLPAGSRDASWDFFLKISIFRIEKKNAVSEQKFGKLRKSDREKMSYFDNIYNIFSNLRI